MIVLIFYKTAIVDSFDLTENCSLRVRSAILEGNLRSISGISIRQLLQYQ